MTLPDFARLILLSAIWGGSFLFLRIAAPEFGPIPLIWTRVAGAVLVLSPLLASKRVRRELRENIGHLLIVGIFNAVIPWTLLAHAVLSLEAGFTSLLNAATPIFAALIGLVWLRRPLTSWQVLGLILGVSGVAILAGDQLSFRPGGSGWAILAGLAAAASYGFISHYTTRYLGGVSTRSLVMGNLITATILLTPMAFLTLPDSVPSWPSIWSAAGLALLSTAVAFVLLFQILSRAGATATTTVTFIIPVFAVLFGALVLDEKVTLRIGLGMLTVFAGAALTTKLFPKKANASTPESNGSPDR